MKLFHLPKLEKIAVEIRLQLLKGIDPINERERTKQANLLKQARAITFEEAANR